MMSKAVELSHLSIEESSLLRLFALSSRKFASPSSAKWSAQRWACAALGSSPSVK
jgi:hypothetical protein